MEEHDRLRYRIEETIKAREILAEAEEEEEMHRTAVDAAAGERRQLEERRTRLEKQAAEQKAHMLEARLALEREQKERASAEKAALEARLGEAHGLRDKAQAEAEAEAAENELAKLRLTDSQMEVARLKQELERHQELLQRQELSVDDAERPQRFGTDFLSPRDEALYAEADAADPQRSGPPTPNDAFGCRRHPPLGPTLSAAKRPTSLGDRSADILTICNAASALGGSTARAGLIDERIPRPGMGLTSPVRATGVRIISTPSSGKRPGTTAGILTAPSSGALDARPGTTASRMSVVSVAMTGSAGEEEGG